MEFQHAYEKTCEARAHLYSQCKTAEDLIAVATAFAFQAGIIWEELQGPAGAAQQLYAAADAMAAKAAKTIKGV